MLLMLKAMLLCATACRLQRVPLQGLDRDALAQQLVSATTLDKAQADALVAGLTREMCLIQAQVWRTEAGLQCADEQQTLYYSVIV